MAFSSTGAHNPPVEWKVTPPRDLEQTRVDLDVEGLQRRVPQAHVGGGAGARADYLAHHQLDGVPRPRVDDGGQGGQEPAVAELVLVDIPQRWEVLEQGLARPYVARLQIQIGREVPPSPSSSPFRRAPRCRGRPGPPGHPCGGAAAGHAGRPARAEPQIENVAQFGGLLVPCLLSAPGSLAYPAPACAS